MAGGRRRGGHAVSVPSQTPTHPRGDDRIGPSCALSVPVSCQFDPGSAKRRPLRRGEKPIVLAPPTRLARRPHRGADEGERGSGDRERERDDGLPGEHLERAVERPIESRAGRDGTASLLGSELELDRRVPASAAVAARLARSSRQLRLRLRALLDQARALGRGRRPLELDGERGDLRAKPLAARGRSRRATPGGPGSGRSGRRSCREPRAERRRPPARPTGRAA